MIMTNTKSGTITKANYGYSKFDETDELYLELEIKMVDRWLCLMKFNQKLIKPILDLFLYDKTFRHIKSLVGKKVVLLEHENEHYAPIAITSPFIKSQWIYKSGYYDKDSNQCDCFEENLDDSNLLTGLPIIENKRLPNRTHKVLYNDYHIPLKVECSSDLYEEMMRLKEYEFKINMDKISVSRGD